jgi:hypothetical protein
MPNGDVKLSQPHLIKQIIDEVKLSQLVAGKQMPAASTKILQWDKKVTPFDDQFNYWHIISKLNFLEKLT